MKKLAILSSLFLLALNSCSNEDIINEELSNNFEKRISVVAEDLVPANGTRTSYTDNGNGYSFAWTEGDDMGIIPQNGTHIQFTIGKGAGTNTAVFDGGDWALKPNTSYAAYYPLQHDFDLNKKAIPVSYLGQTQDGNGDTRHLAQYDYMASEFTKVDAKGNVSLKLKHLGSLMQLKLTMPKADTFNKVEIVSDDAKFINEGTYDITSDNPTIKVTDASNSFRIDLKNVSTTFDNEELKINFMLAPVDYSLSQFRVTIYGNNSEYTTTFYSDNLVEGGVYSIESDIVVINIPYVTFHAESSQTLRMTKAVQSIEYSVNNGEWAELGTKTVTFGGSNGELMIRGKNPNGTATSTSNYSYIKFGNSTKVSCQGDIRTLIDYENYKTVNTEDARFSRLFWDCTSLTSAPELPATTLADGCYASMFYGCTSLTQAPGLPATTLAEECYSSMFGGCRSLTVVPKLPATTLAESCYNGMFYGCTSLTQAPELPATALASNCYAYMFHGCSSLTVVPKLPATTLAENCYYYMFWNCKSLTQAPELPATTLAESCYSAMFWDCKSLAQAPKLPATTLAGSCYASMFHGCATLTTAPELPVTTLARHCYNSMFEGCTSLVKATKLPATTLTDYCYSYMFKDCTSLTNAPELPATTLSVGCYVYMFTSCSSLKTAPILPATTLTQSCYEGMFADCSSLSYVKMLATNISATACLNNWLSNVAPNGIFVQNSAAFWINRGSSGIPTDWTVEYADK